MSTSTISEFDSVPGLWRGGTWSINALLSIPSRTFFMTGSGPDFDLQPARDDALDRPESSDADARPGTRSWDRSKEYMFEFGLKISEPEWKRYDPKLRCRTGESPRHRPNLPYDRVALRCDGLGFKDYVETRLDAAEIRDQSLGVIPPLFSSPRRSLALRSQNVYSKPFSEYLQLAALTGRVGGRRPSNPRSLSDSTAVERSRRAGYRVTIWAQDDALPTAGSSQTTGTDHGDSLQFIRRSCLYVCMYRDLSMTHVAAAGRKGGRIRLSGPLDLGRREGHVPSLAEEERVFSRVGRSRRTPIDSSSLGLEAPSYGFPARARARAGAPLARLGVKRTSTPSPTQGSSQAVSLPPADANSHGRPPHPGMEIYSPPSIQQAGIECLFRRRLAQLELELELAISHPSRRLSRLRFSVYPSCPPARMVQLQAACYGIVTIFFITSTLTIFLRIYSRGFIVKSFGWDDWCMSSIFLFNCGQQVLLYYFLHYGGGLNTDVVMRSHPEWLPKLTTALFVEEMYYVLMHWIIKMAFLLFYLRFATKLFRTLVFCTIGLNCVFTVAQWLLYCLQCLPLDALFHPAAHPSVRCVDNKVLAFLPAALNIMTDVCIVVLPIRPLWKIQISRRRRLQLLGIVSLGGIVVLISILRLTVLRDFQRMTDFTHSLGKIIIVSCIELEVAIMAANAPSLRIFFGGGDGGDSAPGAPDAHTLCDLSRDGKQRLAVTSSTCRITSKAAAQEALVSNSSEESLAKHASHAGIQVTSSVGVEYHDASRDSRQSRSAQSDGFSVV
ncbi:unnamed protein product [Diplocarpon coronariae]